MATRRNVTVRQLPVSPESDQLLQDEAILQWRELGPAAAWQAMLDMLDWWFEARGLDPETQRVDRTHIEIRPAPWATAAPEDDPGE